MIEVLEWPGKAGNFWENKFALGAALAYRAQVRVKGRPAKSETFPNRKEAEKWASGLESAIRENPHQPHLAGGKKSFGEAVTKYLTTVVHSSKAQCLNLLGIWHKTLVLRIFVVPSPGLEPG